MSKSENVPYEKWSRESFKSAYEEADALLTKMRQERNQLKELADKAQSWKNTAEMWGRHALVLGEAINNLNQLLSKRP